MKKVTTTNNGSSSSRSSAPDVLFTPVAQYQPPSANMPAGNSPPGNHNLLSPSSPTPPPSADLTSTLLGNIAKKFIEDSSTEPSSPLSHSSTPSSSSASVASNSAINAHSLITKEFTAKHFFDLTQILLGKKNNFSPTESLTIPEKLEEKLRNDVLLRKVLQDDANTNSHPPSSSDTHLPTTDLSEIPLCLDQLCTLINDCHLWLKNTFRKVEAEVNTTTEFHNLKKKEEKKTESGTEKANATIILDNTKEILQIYYYLIKALIFLQKNHGDSFILSGNHWYTRLYNYVFKRHPLQDPEQIKDATDTLNELAPLVELTLHNTKDKDKDNELLVKFFNLKDTEGLKQLEAPKEKIKWYKKWWQKVCDNKVVKGVVKGIKICTRHLIHAATVVKGIASGALSAYSIRKMARLFVAKTAEDTPVIDFLMVAFFISNTFDTLWTRGSAMNNALAKIREQTSWFLPKLLKTGGNYGLKDTFFTIYNSGMAFLTVLSMILDGANGGFSARSLCQIIDIFSSDAKAENYYDHTPSFKWSLFSILAASAAWSGLAFQFLPIFNVRDLRDKLSKMPKGWDLVRGLLFGTASVVGSATYASIQSGQTVDGFVNELTHVDPNIIRALVWIFLGPKLATLAASQGIKCTITALDIKNPWDKMFNPEQQKLKKYNEQKNLREKIWDASCVAAISLDTLLNLGFVTATTIFGFYRTVFDIAKADSDMHEYTTITQMLTICMGGGIIGLANMVSVYLFSEYPVIDKYSDEFRTQFTTLPQRLKNLLRSLIGLTNPKVPSLQKLPETIIPSEKEENTHTNEKLAKLKLASKKIWPIAGGELLAYFSLTLAQNFITNLLATNSTQTIIRTGMDIFCPPDLSHSEMCLNYKEQPGMLDQVILTLISAFDKFNFLEFIKPSSAFLIFVLPMLNITIRLFIINSCFRPSTTQSTNSQHQAENGAIMLASNPLTVIQPTCRQKYWSTIKDEVLPEVVMGTVFGGLAYITSLPRYSDYTYAPIRDLTVITKAQRDFDSNRICRAPDGQIIPVVDCDCGGKVAVLLGKAATTYCLDYNPLLRYSMQGVIGLFTILLEVIKSTYSSSKNRREQESTKSALVKLHAVASSSSSPSPSPRSLISIAPSNSYTARTRLSDFFDSHSSPSSPKRRDASALPNASGAVVSHQFSSTRLEDYISINHAASSASTPTETTPLISKKSS